MSLRERHRQLLNQTSKNKDLFEEDKRPTLRQRLSEKRIDEQAEAVQNESNQTPLEPIHPQPSPINPSIGLNRPTTAPVFPPSEADLARKKYLAEAKERNDKSRKEFETRVKGYFEKGLDIEKRKMENANSVKKSNKDANHEKVESGLFLQQLKSIGLDVGKMMTATNAMKPSKDEGGGRRGRYAAEDEEPVSSYSVPESSYSSPEMTPSYHSTSPSTSLEFETRLARIEMTVNSIQRSVNEHDKKLDTSIELQRQILSLLQAQGGGATSSSSSSVTPLEEPTTRTMPQMGRRRR